LGGTGEPPVPLAQISNLIALSPMQWMVTKMPDGLYCCQQPIAI
jgi:hypothetical protein